MTPTEVVSSSPNIYEKESIQYDCSSFNIASAIEEKPKTKQFLTDLSKSVDLKAIENPRIIDSVIK
jgi:hypothetical protein